MRNTWNISGTKSTLGGKSVHIGSAMGARLPSMKESESSTEYSRAPRRVEVEDVKLKYHFNLNLLNTINAEPDVQNSSLQSIHSVQSIQFVRLYSSLILPSFRRDFCIENTISLTSLSTKIFFLIGGVYSFPGKTLSTAQLTFSC